jgi:hypothetical protein
MCRGKLDCYSQHREGWSAGAQAQGKGRHSPAQECGEGPVGVLGGGGLAEMPDCRSTVEHRDARSKP